MFKAEYEESEQDIRNALALMANDFSIEKKRTLIVAVIFITSFVIASPFMADQPLHRYWSSFGKFLPLVSIALFVVLTLQLLRLQFVWQEKRKAQHDLKDLLTRRKA